MQPLHFTRTLDLADVVRSCHARNKACERWAKGRIAIPTKHWPAGRWKEPAPLVQWIGEDLGLDEVRSHEALVLAEALDLIMLHDGYGRAHVRAAGRAMIGLEEQERV